MTVKSCKARNTDEEFVVLQGRIGFEPRRSTTGKRQLTLSRPRQQHVCKGAARHSAANHLRSVDDHDRGSLCAFAAGIRLYAGHTLLIAAVGLRLVFITPDLELDDHLRHRQTSAIVLMVSSLPAIADQLRRPRGGAVGACPEFCPPVDPEVERPGGFAWLNRRRRSIDYGIVRFARDVDGSPGGEQE